MTKFPGRADPGYIAVKGEILRPVRGIRREQTVLTTVQEGVD